MTRREKFFLFSIFVLPCFFLCGTLISSKTFFMRDLTYLFHPWRSLSSQMMQSGKMPLWNSYAMGGMPFLANCQSAIFYPFTLFFNFFSFSTALKIFHLFHYALAGVGTYLLARKMGWSCFISWAGAVLFSYNGYLLTRLEFLSILGSVIWLPWIFLFSYISISPIALALTLTFSLFAGFPQILLLQLVALLLFLLIQKKSYSSARLIAVSFLLFILLSAVQWIPTIELLLQSGRGGKGVSFQEAITYSLPTDSLLGLIYPFKILHHPDRFTGEKFFWIWSAWWGIVASFILPFSLKSRSKKLFWFAGILSLGGLVWAMGNQWSWFEKLYAWIPMVHWFRYPPVTLYWTVMGVSLLLMTALNAIENLRWGKFLLALFIPLMTLELFNYSRRLHPTVPSDYYHVTYSGIESILKDTPGTVMLSNRLDAQRRLAGMTDLDARMRFRSSFFDLTNLPYQVKSIAFSGEPLALKSYKNLYDRLVQSQTLEEARPILNLWNVTHFLTYNALDPSWTLLATDSELKIYKNPLSLGETFAIPEENSSLLNLNRSIAPITLKNTNDKVTASYSSNKNLRIIFSRPTYSGWKIFCLKDKNKSGSYLPIHRVEGYFIGTQIESGSNTLYLFYQPLCWMIALSLSAATILVLAGISFKRAH